MENDSLKIVLEAALDLAKSLQNITADLNTLTSKLKNSQIKIAAGLNKQASRAKIKSDLEQLSKSKNTIKIAAQLDKAASKQNINADIDKIKVKQFKVDAALNTAAVKQQMSQIPSMKVKADAEVNGTQEVDDLRQKMDNAGNSAESMASRLYLVRTALQLVQRAAHEAVDTIKELDAAATNLAIVTGSKTSDMYELLSKYNSVAKELRATTTQVAGAAESWLRQGKTTAETASLIEQSMILSKTAMMSSEDATKRLTSALNGYKLEAQDAASVVDKLAALDSKAAVTANDLAVAMSQTASSANIGGVSMDRLLGYLATVQEVTQRSAETIGQSFKTVFARIGNIKLGNFLSDDGENLSDVETVLKSYGIALRSVEGDFRNFSTILDELSEKWEMFEAVDKRAIAQAFAGTRQQENFLVLMENYGKALEYAGVAADSAGTSFKKFEAYQDSIEAKSAKFAAAIEGLALDTVDAGVVGDLIDAGTAIIELVEKTDLLKAAIMSLGAGAVLKGISAISSEFLAAKQNILNLGEAVQTLRNVQNAGALSAETITRLGSLTKGLTDEQLKLVLSTQELSTAQMSQILMAGGLSQAEAAAKLQTLGLATAEGTATAATFTLSGAMTGLGTAIRAAFASNPVGMIMLAVGAAYELVRGVMAIYDAVTVTAEEATEAMEKSFSEFEEAENNVKSINDELKTTQDRIDELNAKDSLTFVEESELQKLRESVELLQIQADLAEKERIREAKEAADDTVMAYKKNFKSDITSDAIQGYIDYSNISGNNAALFADESNISAMLAGIEQMKRLRDELDRSNEYYQEDYQHSQGIIDDATDSIWEQADALNTYKGNLEAITYDELTDNQKAALDEINAAIELVYKTLDPAKWSEIQWNSIINDDQYADDAKKLKELAFQSEITADTIKEQFPALAQACTDAGIAVEDVVGNINASFKSADGDGVATYTAQLSNLSDVISDLRSSYDLLETAQKDMSNGGGLSPETIEKLAKAEENYLDYLYEENGVVKLNTQAWKANADAKAQDKVDASKKDLEVLKAKSTELRKNIKYYEEQRKLGNDGGIWSDLIAEETSALNENEEAIKSHEKELSIWEAAINGVQQSANGLVSALSNLSTVNGDLDKLSTALGSFKENGSLSIDTLASLSNTFGNLSSFESFVDIMSDSASSIEDVQDACNRLAGEYIDMCGILDDVNENTAQIIERELEEMGVTNAHELIQARLNAVKLEGVLASKNLVDASWEVAEQTLKESGALESAIASLKRFRQEQYNAKLAAIDFVDASASTIASLLSQAKAAGVAAEQLVALEKIKFFAERFERAKADPNVVVSATAEKNYYDTIERLRDRAKAELSDLGSLTVPQVKVSLPKSSSKSSSGSSTKEIEEYTVAINEYREAEERLRKAQEARGNIESQIDESNDLKEKILLEKQLIGAYEREQEALRNLNDQRSDTITAGVKSLRELGFAVKYNADTNELWVENMEHLNELVADGKGEYDTLQEATNALRKDTEDLIGTLTDLNEANREGSKNWRDLQNSLEDARKEILDLLNEIPEKVSESLDSLQDLYDTLHAAADEYAESGCVAIDTLQSIRDMGMQYLAYLMDENGQLVINEERIRNVIAARTQQMAIESSLSYIEALKIAKMEGDIATLNTLLYATEEATNATWGFVYASLAMAGLDDQQYQAALHNINAIRALADSAVHSIGQTAGSVTKELENMKSGVDDILKYVMEMLKQQIHDQIDALEDMKDAYSDLIDLKKDSLEASKDEADYEKKRAALLQKMAKLQARIDALSLDDSRAAQAERAKLLEEMAELQEDLNETQADKALEVTKDSLDAQEDAYRKEKDKEIAILEDSISSYQKLYDMAISYIESHWDTLYSELIGWNTQYGSVLNSEITSAWENCLAAAQRYGSYVSALNSLPSDISAAQNAGQNFIVGQTNYDNKFSKDDQIHAIIKEMYQNSQLWHTADSNTRAALDKRNLELGAQLNGLGINAKRDAVWGSWYVGNERLFDKYKQYIYHGGGIAGDVGTVKDDEILAKLQKGETVLTTQMWDNVTEMVERMDHMNHMMNAFANTPPTMAQPILPDFSRLGGSTVNNVTNNNNSSQPVEIHMGDITVNSNSDSAYVIADEVRKITRDNANQLAKLLGIRR